MCIQPRLFDLPIEEVDYSNWSVRMPEFLDVDQLVNSIIRRGVVIPIGVRKKGTQWELLYGLRRLLAAKEAGLETIPAFDFTGIDDVNAILLFLSENLLRKKLTLIELGRAIILARKAAKNGTR